MKVLSIVLLFISIQCSSTSKPYNPESVANKIQFFPNIPSGKKLNILVFGDSGTGNANQYAVAAGMKKVCDKEGCDFGIMLGDNFYEKGVKNVDDPQFIEKFEKPYSPLKIKFYPVFGNHDYYGSLIFMGKPDAQIEYTQKSEYWRMPHNFYNFTAGDVEFFALDTETLIEGDDVQLSWLKDGLKNSKAKYKIVYGHRPIFSYGKHGDSSYFKKMLYPLFCESKITSYFAGHEHDLQLLKSDCGIPMLISGAAGKTRKTSKGPNTIFADGIFGFNRIEIDSKGMVIKFYNSDGTMVSETLFPTTDKK